MGLVINKLLGSLTMGELSAQLETSPAVQSTRARCISAARSKAAAALFCTRPTIARKAHGMSTTISR